MLIAARSSHFCLLRLRHLAGYDDFRRLIAASGKTNHKAG